jgi:hypothetical protein
MLFKPELVAKVLEGQKTQTRRLWREGDMAIKAGLLYEQTEDSPIKFVRRVTKSGKTRMHRAVKSDYALQPGRGKPGVARIRLDAIRLEHLQDITQQDAQAEGFAGVDEFKSYWDMINNRAGVRWVDNPRVWVLDFTVVERAAEDVLAALAHNLAERNE